MAVVKELGFNPIQERYDGRRIRSQILTKINKLRRIPTFVVCDPGWIRERKFMVIEVITMEADCGNCPYNKRGNCGMRGLEIEDEDYGNACIWHPLNKEEE